MPCGPPSPLASAAAAASPAAPVSRPSLGFRALPPAARPPPCPCPWPGAGSRVVALPLPRARACGVRPSRCGPRSAFGLRPGGRLRPFRPPGRFPRARKVAQWPLSSASGAQSPSSAPSLAVGGGLRLCWAAFAPPRLWGLRRLRPARCSALRCRPGRAAVRGGCCSAGKGG